MAHALLLAGPPHVGKMTLAQDIARMVNCGEQDADKRPCGTCRQCQRISNSLHADVRVISQGGSTRRTVISVEQVRELQREAVLKPYEGRYRVFIIEDADNFTQEAANALLKMLEEPPDDVVFVLLASELRENSADESAGSISNFLDSEQDRIAALLEDVPQVGGILPTILSRCQTLELRPVAARTVEDELKRRFDLGPEDATEIARLSQGRIGWALQAAAEPETLTRLGERLETIEVVASASLDEKFSYAERLAAVFGRSREAAYEELELWLGWWRDVLVTREGIDELVINVSRRDILTSVASACTSTQVVEAIRAVQQTTAMLESNVNPRLCIEGMMLRLPELEYHTQTEEAPST